MTMLVALPPRLRLRVRVPVAPAGRMAWTRDGRSPDRRRRRHDPHRRLVDGRRAWSHRRALAARVYRVRLRLGRQLRGGGQRARLRRSVALRAATARRADRAPRRAHHARSPSPTTIGASSPPATTGASPSGALRRSTRTSSPSADVPTISPTTAAVTPSPSLSGARAWLLLDGTTGERRRTVRPPASRRPRWPGQAASLFVGTREGQLAAYDARAARSAAPQPRRLASARSLSCCRSAMASSSRAPMPSRSVDACRAARCAGAGPTAPPSLAARWRCMAGSRRSRSRCRRRPRSSTSKASRPFAVAAERAGRRGAGAPSPERRGDGRRGDRATCARAAATIVAIVDDSRRFVETARRATTAIVFYGPSGPPLRHDYAVDVLGDARRAHGAGDPARRRGARGAATLSRHRLRLLPRPRAGRRRARPGRARSLPFTRRVARVPSSTPPPVLAGANARGTGGATAPRPARACDRRAPACPRRARRTARACARRTGRARASAASRRR